MTKYTPQPGVQAKSLKEALYRHIPIRPNNGCWEWQGATSSNGYGYLRFKIKQYAAHRASYLVHCGKIPEGEFILHSCDNPSCVNPDHLRIGTQSENIQEMDRKGRRGHVPIEKHARGETHGLSKLTEQNVIDIRNMYATGNYTQTELGQQFGVGHRTIGNIIHRETWKHIE